MTLPWLLFALYMVGTAWLALLGRRRTKGFGSFAIGNGDLSPLVVGITLAASTASAATFIINPGFIYVDGLSAWMHMVPALGIGFITMLSLLSFRFRRIGEKNGALTIPDWIGKHYGSSSFALYFAVLNLLQFAFIVLLVGGISIVMQKLLGVTNEIALLITLVFVTGYVFVGGTYAHVFTNLLQGTLMIGVTLIILGTGVEILLDDQIDLIGLLRAKDPGLLAAVNHDGQLFNNVFSIYVSGFVVGAAIVCQPHILTKALYVKSDRAVRNYIIIFSVVFSLFLLLVTMGFFAHAVVDPQLLIDPVTGFRQDLVMTAYLQAVLPGWLFTVVGVVLLAAAMSTLDGLMVSISTITANDLVLGLVDRFGKRRRTHDEKMALAMKTSHVVLVVIAALVFLVSLNPPRLLGIYGQVGVYGMALAAVAPLLAGILFSRTLVWLVWGASVFAISVHFGLFFFGARLMPASTLTFSNPGVTMTIAVLVAVVPAMIASFLYQRWTAPQQHAVKLANDPPSDTKQVL